MSGPTAAQCLAVLPQPEVHPTTSLVQLPQHRVPQPAPPVLRRTCWPAGSVHLWTAPRLLRPWSSAQPLDEMRCLNYSCTSPQATLQPHYLPRTGSVSVDLCCLQNLTLAFLGKRKRKC